MWEQIFQLDQFIRDQLSSQEIEWIGCFILQLYTETRLVSYRSTREEVSHLILLKFESNQLTESELIEMKQVQKIDVDLRVLQVILERLQNEIQHSIRIDIEVTDQCHQTIVQLFSR